MPAHATAMTPEKEIFARMMAAEGYTKAQTAAAIGVRRNTLSHWAKRRGVEFRNGLLDNLPPQTKAKADAARRNQPKATEASAAARRLPLTKPERGRYEALRDKGRKCGVTITRNDAYIAIGRADLVQP